jgi:hypothetical protein
MCTPYVMNFWSREILGRGNGEMSRLTIKQLLYAVLISVPLTGVRVLYSVAADFSQSASLNPATGSMALIVCLSVLPEMLVVVLFIGFGFWTRNIRRK